MDGRFCLKCGGPAAVPAGAANFAVPPIGMNIQTPPAATAIGVPPLTAAPAANAELTENAVGALCYLGGIVTGIVFLVIAPYNQNPRIKFHALQSILFNLAWVLSWFVIAAVGMVLPFGMSVMLSLFTLLLWGGGLVVWLLLLWKAYQGETLSLPVIGAIAREQAGK